LSRLSIGARCRTLGKPSVGRPATRFERLQLVEKTIELLVRDFGIVVDVVALFVMANQRAKFAKAFLRGLLGQFDLAIA
jgi:hypothetical protein